MARTDFRPKAVGESVNLPFDFQSRLTVGETISSASVSAAVYSGTDANPSALISGSASISGTVVAQLVTGGVEGVMYEVTASAVTSAGQTLLMTGILAIESGYV